MTTHENHFKSVFLSFADQKSHVPIEEQNPDFSGQIRHLKPIRHVPCTLLLHDSHVNRGTMLIGAHVGQLWEH